MSSKLGELLVQEKVISNKDLDGALEVSKKSGERLGSALIKSGAVDEAELTKIISDRYGYDTINLDNFQISMEILELIKPDYCMKKTVIPVMRSGTTLIVAMADPTDFDTIADLKFLTGYNISVTVATESQMSSALSKYYGDLVNEQVDFLEDIDLEIVDEDDDDDEGGTSTKLQTLSIGEETEAPVIKLVNRILMESVRRGASDIHFEPYEESYRLRYRVDGKLEEVMELNNKWKSAIASRLKIMASLDIAERRLPQDGRFKIRMAKDQEMEFRVSILPCIFGEKAVLRLLDKSNLQLDMTKLGFHQEHLDKFQECLLQPFGMILVTGPTGSGKTTTLYSALSFINTVDRNISTAEDPVEFSIPGINQVAVNEEIGLNFSAGLRSFLRQDPDIIMVGEIRDYETAEISIKAALTGHLVLSTLHTNDAPSTIFRLLHMGVEPFLVSSAVSMILAQRLARRICGNCKTDVKISKDVLVKIGFKPEEAGNVKLKGGKGCTVCGGSGYKGRVALYEVMVLNQELKDAILSGASVGEIKEIAMAAGMQTLREAGLDKIREGLTTPEEVEAVSIAD